jgi:hypothetical protein
MNIVHSIVNYIRLGFKIHLFLLLLLLHLLSFILYRITSHVFLFIKNLHFHDDTKLAKLWCHFLHGILKELGPLNLNNMIEHWTQKLKFKTLSNLRNGINDTWVHLFK